MASVETNEQVIAYQEPNVYSKVSTYHYEWTLSCPRGLYGFKAKSPQIVTCENNYKLVWTMNVNNNPFHSIDITLLSCENPANIKGVSTDCKLKFEGTEYDRVVEEWNLRNDIPIVKLLHRMVVENLEFGTLEIELTVKVESSDNLIHSSKLSYGMESLFKSGKQSDVIFKIGTKELRAHEIILTHRSQYFANLFENNMLEKFTREIIIEDISPEIFESFLHYIYTGIIPVIDKENVSDLLIVADRYQEDELKSMCEQMLASTLNVDIASKLLLTAHILNCKYLKNKTMEFIFANKNKVVNTDGYRNLVESHFYLIEEMFRKIHLQLN